MTNSKLIGAGVLVVVGLAVITAGSIALPSLSRGDTYQYKAANFYAIVEGYGESGVLNAEKALNDNAKDGWEYVGLIGGNAIFKKK